MKDNALKQNLEKNKQTGKIRKGIYSFNSVKSSKENNSQQSDSNNNSLSANQSETAGLPSVDYKFILNSNSKLNGELDLSQRALIAGEVSGEIKSDSLVSIALSAKVKANIVAKTIFIAGEVEGELKAEEKIVLLAPAKVFGSIEAGSISISEGVIFEGECRMSKTVSSKDKNKN